jgi:hypothetical protein
VSVAVPLGNSTGLLLNGRVFSREETYGGFGQSPGCESRNDILAAEKLLNRVSRVGRTGSSIIVPGKRGRVEHHADLILLPRIDANLHESGYAVRRIRRLTQDCFHHEVQKDHEGGIRPFLLSGGAGSVRPGLLLPRIRTNEHESFVTDPLESVESV